MTAALTIQGLKLAFYGVQVLRGVDFAVPQGSFAEVASDTRVQEAYLGRRH